ncbi:unnamed protein product [Caenorhabditis nigoni]
MHNKDITKTLSKPVGDFLSSRSSAPPGSNVKADPPVIPVIPPPSVTAQNSYAAPPLWPVRHFRFTGRPDSTSEEPHLAVLPKSDNPFWKI